MNRFVDEKLGNAKDDDDEDQENGDHGDTFGPDNNNNELSISRRKSILLSRHKTRCVKTRGVVNPIYGIGVVFYLDHYGIIQGIMTWGLPFADRPGGSINAELLKHIKSLIATNAGVSALDAEENHQLMNVALGKATQKLVALAVKGHVSHMTRAWHGLDGHIQGFTTPLYRYTEVSNSRNKTVNVLKRKDGSGLGVLGEGLYARDDFILEEKAAGFSNSRSTEKEDDETTPANIPTTMYPITVVPNYQLEESYGGKAISLDTIKELNRYLAAARGWEANENRARPGKEDPIWLRPGDERRTTSGKQNVNDAYRRVMFPHRS